MAADGKVTIEALLDTSEYDAGVKSLSSMTIAAGGLMVDAIEMAVSKTVELGAGVIQAGMSFDSSMSQVAATMGTTVDSIGELRDFALEMGSTTAFSASQAADALNYMALAGYDANTSMEMLPNVLNLAAAGGMELASASDMITDAQSALGLTLEETTSMVDKMAKASSTTNTSVSQLGDAILTVGGTAKNLSGGTTELATVLGLLADNGIKASEGGTHLRNILLAMTPATDAAAGAWESLGVSGYDANGNLRPLEDTFGDLAAAMDGMSTEERTNMISAMFNKTDISAVNALLATSSDRWEEVAGKIDNCEGAAAAMAETQLDNLAGDITLFQSALEGAQIAISDGLTPTLRGFVQFGGTALSTFTEGFKNGGLTGAVQALVPLFQDTFNSVLGSVGEFVPQLFSSLMSGMDYMTEAGVELIEGLASGAAAAIPAFLSQALPMLVEFTGSLRENAGQLIDAGLDLITKLAVGLAKSIPILIETVPDIVTNIAGIINDNAPKMLATAGMIIMMLATGLIQAIPTLVSNVPKIVTAIVSVIQAFNWLNLGKSIITALKDGIMVLSTDLPAALRKIGQDAVQKLKGIDWENLGVAIIKFIRAGISATGAMIKTALTGIGQTALNAFKSINWLNLGKNIVSGIVKGITGAAGSLVSSMKSLASKALSSAKSALGIHSPSTVFENQLGKWIPYGAAVGVDKNSDVFVDSIEDMADEATAIVADLSGSSASVGVTPILEKTAIDGVATRIKAILSADGFSTSARFVASAGSGTDYLSQFEDLVELMKILVDETSEGKCIVLDDGTLVGKISKKMDAALGKRRSAAARGC